MLFKPRVIPSLGLPVMSVVGGSAASVPDNPSHEGLRNATSWHVEMCAVGLTPPDPERSGLRGGAAQTSSVTETSSALNKKQALTEAAVTSAPISTASSEADETHASIDQGNQAAQVQKERCLQASSNAIMPASDDPTPPPQAVDGVQKGKQKDVSLSTAGNSKVIPKSVGQEHHAHTNELSGTGESSIVVATPFACASVQGTQPERVVLPCKYFEAKQEAFVKLSSSSSIPVAGNVVSKTLGTDTGNADQTDEQTFAPHFQSSDEPLQTQGSVSVVAKGSTELAGGKHVSLASEISQTPMDAAATFAYSFANQTGNSNALDEKVGHGGANENNDFDIFPATIRTHDALPLHHLDVSLTDPLAGDIGIRAELRGGVVHAEIRGDIASAMPELHEFLHKNQIAIHAVTLDTTQVVRSSATGGASPSAGNTFDERDGRNGQREHPARDQRSAWVQPGSFDRPETDEPSFVKPAAGLVTQGSTLSIHI